MGGRRVEEQAGAAPISALVKAGGVRVVRVNGGAGGWRIDVGIARPDVELSDVGQDVGGDAGDVQVDFEPSQDAVAKGARRREVGVSSSVTSPRATVIGAVAAGVVVLGKHGSGDADVDAAIE
jgi:hypothetical protein